MRPNTTAVNALESKFMSFSKPVTWSGSIPLHDEEYKSLALRYKAKASTPEGSTASYQ
jgi:hypothetical protein